jgi:hypothetical protein
MHAPPFARGGTLLQQSHAARECARRPAHLTMSGPVRARTKQKKVFWFFLSKKEPALPVHLPQ